VSLLFGKRGRRLAALGVVGLGVCAALSACAPVQMGSAAIVGNQRITVSSLDTQVSNWEAAAKPLGSTVQLTSAQAPGQVLSWLIRFAVMDQVAANNGINVSNAQASAGLSNLSAQASSYGFSSGSQLLIASGIPPQLFQQVGLWNAQVMAYELKVNDGKQPTTQTEETNITNAVNKAECTAAKSLNIQVSPQFGRFDYASATFGVVPGADTLSRPQGTPTAADTEGLTPAAC
jgi:ABC-type lipoprotein release transport system permease subunit